MAKIMNTTEIESALVHFTTSYPDLCQRVQLPEQTHEGRTCHALRIAKDYDRSKPAALVIGGVHAREWGGPDIVVNFAGDILRAYTEGKGLKYLKKSFSASEIKEIIESATVVVFPCVNPDGVEFSHNDNALWRKNRNPASSNGDPDKIGVDINRNYDFLWDYKTYFHPSAWQSTLASDDPSEDTFHGTAPFSEPETRNVRWLLDNFNCALFLDLHSYTGDVLYNWGDDQNQSTDPNQNFGNAAFDRKRGLRDDDYHEYLSPSDQQIASRIAQTVSDAMKAVRNRPYKAVQAFGLYATAGSSDDYVFSRHLAHPGTQKTFGFTIEFNFASDAGGQSPFLVTSDPKVLDATMRDVIPGLIAFCQAAAFTPATAALGAPRALALAAASPQPPSYRTNTANEILRLVNAYEAIASVAGPGGKIAREGLMKAIQKTAEQAAKSSTHPA
jgi:murein tripeptide amidase MpaA